MQDVQPDEQATTPDRSQSGDERCKASVMQANIQKTYMKQRGASMAAYPVDEGMETVRGMMKWRVLSLHRLTVHKICSRSQNPYL